jgi:hypothetical protein
MEFNHRHQSNYDYRKGITSYLEQFQLIGFTNFSFLLFRGFFVTLKKKKQLRHDNFQTI